MRAEVLVELGFAERRTNGRRRPTTCAPVSSASPTRRGAARSRRAGRALYFTNRIGDAVAVFEQALDEVDRAAIRTSTSSSWRS